MYCEPAIVYTVSSLKDLIEKTPNLSRIFYNLQLGGFDFIDTGLDVLLDDNYIDEASDSIKK